MSEKIDILKHRIEACFGVPHESIDAFYEAVCEDRDKKWHEEIQKIGAKATPVLPTDWVQVALEALYEWFDEKWGRIAMPGERDRFVALILKLVREVRLQENQKARILVPMHPIEPSPGQIEKSEMYQKLYQKMKKETTYWWNRYELAVRGFKDEDAIRILGREP
jgi:hypothetical protein